MTREEAINHIKYGLIEGNYPLPKEIGIEALKIAIKALEQELKTGWIPVRDTLPIVGEDVLICDLDGDMYISYLHTDGRWGYDECGNKLKNIIAWLPLPEPYESEE